MKPMVWKERVKQATVIKQWRRKDMIMMAPVTERRCKKKTVMTAPVTEQSPARYIVKYLAIAASLTSNSSIAIS